MQTTTTRQTSSLEDSSSEEVSSSAGVTMAACHASIMGQFWLFEPQAHAQSIDTATHEHMDVHAGQTLEAAGVAAPFTLAGASSSSEEDSSSLLLLSSYIPSVQSSANGQRRVTQCCVEGLTERPTLTIFFLVSAFTAACLTLASFLLTLL